MIELRDKHVSYLESWGEEIFEEPELDWVVRLLENTQHHNPGRNQHVQDGLQPPILTRTHIMLSARLYLRNLS